MAVLDFVVTLMEEILKDKKLGLTEQDIRFYDRGTTAAEDESLDNHIRWQNAHYFNENSNVVRSSILVIQFPFENGSQYVNFHVGELYRTYRKDGMKAILPIVKNDIKNVRASAAQNVALINQFSNYEAIKDRLIVRPLNYDDNEKKLAEGIYRQVGDMALVLYISMDNREFNGGQQIMSAMVRQDLFRMWEVEENAAFDWALANTMRLQPPTFCDITSGLSNQYEAKHILFMDDESVHIDFNNPFAPPLSTKQEVNGAIAAFYPGVLERIYKMIGEDFYLVFSSIFNVHIHPVNGANTVASMRRSLANMNKTMNRRGELLTREIYWYSGAEKNIQIVPS